MQQNRLHIISVYYFGNIFTFHLLTEGIIEISITTAETEKAKWIALKNSAIVDLDMTMDDAWNEPENNCSAVCSGIILVIIRNTRPILNEFPAMTNVVLTLADTPLLVEGTEVIIDALFGEANIPIPAPIITSGIMIS